MVRQFLREHGMEFQEGITVSAVEAEYCEILWRDIDNTGSCRVQVLRSLAGRQ